MSTSFKLHTLFQSKNLSALVTNARALLSNPVVITDLNHVVLAASEEPEIKDGKWLSIIKNGKLETSPDVSDVYHRSQLLHKPLLNRDTMDSVDVMRMAVAHNDQLLGFLEIPCYNSIPNEEEQALIMFISDIACLIMKRDLGYLHAPSDEKFFFIHDLIEGRIKDENTCRARCAALNWNITGFYKLITISQKLRATPSPADSLWEKRKLLEKKIPEITSFLEGEKLRVIVPVYEDTALDGNFFSTLIDFLKENNLEAGISRTTDKLLEMSILRLTSEKALYYGQQLRSDELLFFYDKYAVYHLLEYCDEEKEVMAFCHSAIITLAEYDRKHSTELLSTLRTFLYNRQNIADSAAQLFIHRNTMNNRLQKIDDLIHVELDDSENIFHLMLSFHILEYIGVNKIYDYESRISQVPQLKHQ